MPQISRRTFVNRTPKGAILPVNPRHLIGLVLLCAITTLAGCATPPSDPALRAEFEATNDPFEPVNRKIFDFNMFVDRILLKPVAEGYEAVVPAGGRNAIRHFLDNLDEPVVFANDLLQGQFSRANLTAGRLHIKKTIGIGGFLDPATRAGAKQQVGDFGQTLYAWGAPDGPFLMLPLLGPSDVRDAIGTGVDDYIDPFDRLASAYGYSAVGYGRFAIWGIDERARNIDTFDQLQRNAIDLYAELRSLWRQHRASILNGGKPTPIPELDSLYLDPDAPHPSVSGVASRVSR